MKVARWEERSEDNVSARAFRARMLIVRSGPSPLKILITPYGTIDAT